MSKQIDLIIAEIEEEFSQYKSAGLIDRASMYRWANLELRRFGQALFPLHETSVQIQNGEGRLPKNFHSLHLALKCTWKGYHVEKDKEPLLQKSLVWEEKVEHHRTFNPCDPCCYEETSSVIEEKVYYDGAMFRVYYDNPIPLRLGKTLIKNGTCSADCKNRFVVDSPYEININNFVLHTNFPDGIVYIQYYGLEMDEKGLLMVAETPRNFLETYIEYHLKRKLLEKIAFNGDDVNVVNQLKYIREEERRLLPSAEADVKFMTLTPDSYRKIKENNRRNMQRVESLTTSFFHPRFR
jgi:hypothetical protein